jgi:hypothetical protein
MSRENLDKLTKRKVDMCKVYEHQACSLLHVLRKLEHDRSAPHDDDLKPGRDNSLHPLPISQHSTISLWDALNAFLIDKEL